MGNGKRETVQYSRYFFIVLLAGCFLFSALTVSCGRRADPFLGPSYEEGLKEEGEDNHKTGDESISKKEPAEESETKTIVPEAPAGLVAVYTGKSIVLTWEEVTEQGVKSYRIYRSSGDKYEMIGETVTPAFTDRGIKRDRKYYYKVSAVGASEGPMSEEIIVATDRE